MTLPVSWVEPILAKLTALYGQPFVRQYADLNPEVVKATWAEVLDGFDRNPEALRYAFEHLPEEPVNAMQFRAIARRAPPPDAKALPWADGDAPPPRIGRMVKAMRKQQRSHLPAQDCIDRIESIVQRRGGTLSEAQRHVVAHCLRIPGTTTTLPVRKAGDVQLSEEIAA